MSGYAPGFLDDWWRDRLASGVLQIVAEGRARMTDAAADALVLQLGGAQR